MNIKIVKASDEYLIKNLTHNRFIENDKDFYLKSGSFNSRNSELQPIPGGLYDSRIFGSMYENRCNCGATSRVGSKCSICGSRVLSEAERLTRYGALSATVYYSNEYRLKVAWDLLNSSFDKVVVVAEDDSQISSMMSRDGSLMFKMMNYQYNYINGTVELTDELTDEDKIGLEGLRTLFYKYKRSKVDELLGLMNKVIPVLPVALRPVRLSILDGKKKLEVSKHTIAYRNIMYMISEINKAINSSNDIYERTLLRSSLGIYIGKTLLNSFSGFNKSSKNNIARLGYTSRVDRSGRAVITPDPTLKPDEVRLPISLIYEMYKSEFIAYISSSYDIDVERAKGLYIEASPEVLNLFEQFLDEYDKHVLLNRNPTLHKYNILCLKVYVSRDNTIKLPMVLCKPFGGDFDGDEMNFFAVPNDYKDYCVENASPKSMVYYEKDKSFIFKFGHEVLNGLIISSKIKPVDEPRSYVSIDDIEQDYFNNDIEVYTEVTLNGISTSYGREKISGILGYPLNAIMGDKVAINAKSVSLIYKYLSTLPDNDRMSIMRDLQEFALQSVYLEGETTLPLSDIYRDIDKEYLDDIKKIESNDSLPQDIKTAKIDDLYTEYIDKYTRDMKPEIKTRIEESDRMKMSSFLDMAMPHAIMKSDGSVILGEESLVTGLSEQGLKEQALNNRQILELKFNSVSTTGWQTRQLATIGHKLVMKEGSDEDNTCINIPINRAEGRVAPNGSRYPKSDDNKLVPVRSILSSELTYMTPDMVSSFIRINYDYDGTNNIGVSFMESLTESSTQKGLSLKHGGKLFGIMPEEHFLAPFDCTLNLYEKYFELVDKSGNISRYPRTTSQLFYTDKESFNEGDTIYKVSNLRTFSYRLDQLSLMIGSMGKVTLDDIANKIKQNRCIFLGTSAKINYDYENGKMMVGSEIIPLEQGVVYFLPEGSEVKFGDKFCSGNENIRSVSRKLSYLDTYYIFRSQFCSIMPDISEEIIEVLYYLVTDKNGNLIGVHQSNIRNDSFMERLGYGYSKDGIIFAIKGDLEVKDTPYTRTVINPFFIGKLLDEMNNGK